MMVACEIILKVQMHFLLKHANMYEANISSTIIQSKHDIQKKKKKQQQA